MGKLQATLCGRRPLRIITDDKHGLKGKAERQPEILACIQVQALPLTREVTLNKLLQLPQCPHLSFGDNKADVSIYRHQAEPPERSGAGTGSPSPIAANILTAFLFSHCDDSERAMICFSSSIRGCLQAWEKARLCLLSVLPSLVFSEALKTPEIPPQDTGTWSAAGVTASTLCAPDVPLRAFSKDFPFKCQHTCQPRCPEISASCSFMLTASLKLNDGDSFRAG